MTGAGRRPRIRLIALGGTIASTADHAGHAHPRLSGEQLLSAVPALAAVAEIDRVETLPPAPSCEIGWACVLDVAERIERARLAGVDGVVVTQGTDSIEDTSYAWDLLVPPGIAVAVTGAMRHSDQPGADGPANLVDAVRVAGCPVAARHGVLVTLAGQVHSARAVRKLHTSSVAAFGSPRGPVGEISEDRVQLGPPPPARTPRAPLPSRDDIPAVPLVRVCFDDDGWWLPAVRAAAGAVIEGFGGGHLPTRLAEQVFTLAAEKPVVLASRTGGGSLLRKTYGGFSGAEVELLAAGLVSAGDLGGMKARIALSLMLSRGMSRATVADSFADLNGERTHPAEQLIASP